MDLRLTAETQRLPESACEHGALTHYRAIEGLVGAIRAGAPLEPMLDAIMEQTHLGSAAATRDIERLAKPKVLHG